MTPSDTRDRILDEALALFAERGFDGVSIRDLAGRLNLSTSALYYHFDSKEAFLQALALPYLERGEALLSAHPPSDTSSRAGKRALLVAYLDLVSHDPRLARIMAYDPAVTQHPDFGPRMAAVVDGLLERLAAPSRSQTARVRAAAALGALRRPVLETEVTVSDDAVLLEAALAMLPE